MSDQPEGSYPSREDVTDALADMAKAAERAASGWSEAREGQRLIQAVSEQKIEARRHHP